MLEMPTKVLPSTSCRAGVGPRWRRHNNPGSQQQSHSQPDGRQCQTRRPRLSVPSNRSRHDMRQKELMRIKEVQLDALSRSRSSTYSGSNSSGEENGGYTNLGRTGPSNANNANKRYDNQNEDKLSDVSSGSEAFFQRHYNSLLTNRTEKRNPRPQPSERQQNQPFRSKQQRLKNRPMQLCSSHQRQVMSSSSAAAKCGADPSNSQIAYQVALSPLISSDASSSEVHYTERANTDISACARYLAKLAKQNMNTSNRQKHRQQQRQRQELSPPQLLMPRSQSPLSRPPVRQQRQQQQQQQQPAEQPFRSRRSNTSNRQQCYSDVEYEENASNREDIYNDDRRRRSSYRQYDQTVAAVPPPRKHQQQLQQKQQQQKKRLQFRQQEQPQLQQLPRFLEHQIEKLYAGNHAQSDVVVSGRRKPERSEFRYEANDCDRDESDEDFCREEYEEVDDVQPSSVQQRFKSPERQTSRRLKKRDRETYLDQQMVTSRPRHWCRDVSRLCPAQSRRETLFSCPYVTLSLLSKTYECEDCATAARKEQRSERRDRQFQRERLNDSDDVAADWSKNYR